MQNDILFDNIYIGHSIGDALALQQSTFDKKIAVEQAEEAAATPKPDEKAPPKSPMDLKFLDDPVLYVKEKTQLFIAIAKRDPVEAIRFVPEVAAGFLGGVVLLFLAVGVALGGGAKAAPSKEQVSAQAQKAKDAALKTKDQVAAQVASATEQVKGEVNKRTTRSAPADQ